MVKVNLKNKFSFFKKPKSNDSNNTYELENIDTSATWFQSMEPVTYAKKNGKKLYVFKNIKTKHKDSKVFKELLFNNLKKQLDQLKKKIKQEFLKTSDGSLNVGLNVILIDSMLREIINNAHQHVFGNINYKLSTPSSGCDCPFDLASHAILGVINYKEISSVDYIEITDLRSFVGQYGGFKDGIVYIDSDKTKSNFRSINSAFKYAKVLSHLSDSIGTPRVIFSPGLHTLCVENLFVQESQINDESKYKLIAESIYDNGLYIDFPVIIEGCGESTVLSFSSKWADSTSFEHFCGKRQT